MKQEPSEARWGRPGSPRDETSEEMEGAASDPAQSGQAYSPPSSHLRASASVRELHTWPSSTGRRTSAGLERLPT